MEFGLIWKSIGEVCLWLNGCFRDEVLIIVGLDG